MSISFSGLASGLDTASWVESLVALKRAKVTALQEEKENVLLSKDTLNSIKSFFSSFRSTIEKITDSRFNIVSMDLFAQNLATSANLNILTASATTEAEEGTYKVKVDKLASKTNAVSNYKYKTTIVETTTATSNSLLKNLGVTTGTVGVTVDGIKHGVAITESDTIATFIEKLQKIGVEASFNEASGVFSMNIGESDIDDSIDNTGIVNALHLEGVNEGYKTVDKLEIQHVETKWTPADNDTLLKDLGVSAGTIEISANNAAYDITIDDTTTLGEFVSALRDNDINANLSAEGIFTLTDATITNEGTTNIISAMGLQTDIYAKTQATGALTHQTVIVETTTATSATLLKDIGEGTAIADGQTVIVKNSNNEYTTIEVGETTTIGELLADISNAGLSASINSNGIVEITGGTITGGTFDAVSALGLEAEPYTAMVTGNSLTETVVEHELVNMNTRLVDDMGVTEGYLEVTDADGNKFYEKIYSGQTIGNLMADLANLGIHSTLDEENGILEITGGAFATLTDADVQALVDSNTIAETDSRYIKGTNLLECLYGSGTIATDQITVASAYSRTRALTYSVTNLANATLDTTLGALGLTDGTAIFDARGEEVTVNVTSDMTVQGLMDALSAQGIESSWDTENSRLTINNTTLTGGSSNLGDVLNLSTEIAGKYVTSDALNAQSSITIDATEDTTLNRLGINTTETVILNNEDGSTYTFTVDGTTSLESLLTTINNNGATATLENGVLSIDGGYLTNPALESALGLTSSVLGYSNILGNKITHTVTTTATGESSLSEIITALGAESIVASGYDLSFNSTALSVDESTTLNDLMYQIHTLGGTASVDATGRLHIEGGTLTGTVATALGFSSVSTTAAVGATGQILETITTLNADSTTKLSALGLGTSTITISKDDGVEVGTITTNADMTIGDLFSALAGYGISGTINNGVISLDSNNGHYATGGVLESMGIGTTEGTYSTVVGMNVTSTEPVTYTSTVYTTTTEVTTQTIYTTNTIVTTEAVVGTQTITITDTIVTTEAVVGTQTMLITHTIVTTEPVIGTQTITITDTVITTEPVIGTSTIFITETITTTQTLNVEQTVTVQATATVTIEPTETTTVDAIATEATTFKELGITNESLTDWTIAYERHNKDGTTADTGLVGALNENSTLGDFVSIINNSTSGDFNAQLVNGVITITDSTPDNETQDIITGELCQALGIEIQTTQTTITSTATRDTTFADLGIDVSDWQIYATRYDTNGNVIGSGAPSGQTFTQESTVGDFMDYITSGSIVANWTASLENGVITITNTVANNIVITGELAEALGIEVITTVIATGTTTIGNTITSTAPITYTQTIAENNIGKTVSSTAAVTNTTSRAWSLPSAYPPLNVTHAGINSSGSIVGSGTVVAVTSESFQYMAGHTYEGYHFILEENVTSNFQGNIKLLNCTFDGNGYIIDCSSAHLDYSSEVQAQYAGSGYYVAEGLFSEIGNSTIENVNLVNYRTYTTNLDVRNSNSKIASGALVGVAQSSTIQNCRVSIENIDPYGNNEKTNINETYAGGLVGIALYSDINHCEVSGSISGSYDECDYAGGLVGRQTSGTISHCSVNMQTLDAYGYAGGIVGYYDQTGTINKCWVGGNWYTSTMTNAGLFSGEGYLGAENNYLISSFRGAETGALQSYTYTPSTLNYNNFKNAVASDSQWNISENQLAPPILNINQGWKGQNYIAIYNAGGELQGFATISDTSTAAEIADAITEAGGTVSASYNSSTKIFTISGGYINNDTLSDALGLSCGASATLGQFTRQTATLNDISVVNTLKMSSTLSSFATQLSSDTMTISINTTSGENVTSFVVDSTTTVQNIADAIGTYASVAVSGGKLSITPNTGYSFTLESGSIDGIVESLKLDSTGGIENAGTKLFPFDGIDEINTTTRLSSSTYVDTNGSIIGSDTIVEIRTAESLLAMYGKTYSDKTFILTGDLILEGAINVAAMGHQCGIALTNCVFDGQGYSLGINLTITDSATVSTVAGACPYGGIFSTVLGGEIKNLSLRSVIDTVGYYSRNAAIGGLVGVAIDACFSNIKSLVDIVDQQNGVGTHIGGLVGRAVNSSFNSISSTGNITGNNSTSIGGIVGSSEDNNYTRIHTSFVIMKQASRIAGVAGLSSNDSFQGIIDQGIWRIGLSLTPTADIWSIVANISSSPATSLQDIYTTKGGDVFHDGTGYQIHLAADQRYNWTNLFDESTGLPILDTQTEYSGELISGCYNVTGQFMGNITVNADTTVEDLIAKLNAKEITASYNSETGAVNINGYIDSAAIASQLNLSTTFYGSDYTQNGNTNNIAQGSVHTLTADGSTTIETLLLGNGATHIPTYYIGTINVYTTSGTLVDFVTFNADSTIDSIINDLDDYASGEITNGILTITPDSGYIFRTRINPTILDVLNIEKIHGGHTTSVIESTTFYNTESDLLSVDIKNTEYSNSDSNILTFESVIAAGTATTLTISTTGTATITVSQTMTSEETVVHTIVNEHTTTTIVTHNVEATFTVENTTTQPVTHTIVTTIEVDTTELQTVTHTIEATFTVENTTTQPVTVTVVGTATIELPTESVTATETTVKLNYDTNLWDLIEQKVGVLYDAPVFKIEGIPKFTITSSTTFGEYAAELAKYDIEMFVDSEGKVTVKNNGNSLITDFGSAFVIDDAIEKDVIAEALKIKAGSGNTFTITVHTTYDNTDSNTLLQTVTAAATGATELQYLRNDSGNGPTGYELILDTTSNAGNEFLTITFSATSTVYDVIDELAQHGLAATIDSLGRFSVNSTTLTDFDISGDLGTFLMGSYTKVYDEGQINSVSTNLIQQTVVNMDDSTLMSKIGITNGNLVISKDRSNYTISIDSSKTIGEFRAQLAELGLTSSIVDGRLQVSHNGELSFAEAPTDASNVITVLGLGNSTGGSDSENYSQTSKHLYDTQGTSGAASMSNKLSELTDSSGNNLGITAGQIYVYQDGTRNTINIDPNDTLQDLAVKLSQYGITMGMSSDGKLYFDGNNNSYMTTDGIASDSASNILTKFNILNNWSTRYNSTSDTLSYEVQEDAKVNGSTKLVDLQDSDGNSLGITEGNYYVYQNGVRTTESISADTTVDDFVSTLATYGMTASFDETGALSVGGYNETYLATSATSGDDTNAIDVLFEQWNFTNVYTSNNLDIPTDVIVAISETTELGNINGGAYQAGYITVIKDGVQTDIELLGHDTVGDLMDELALFGFESVINAHGQLIIKNTGNSLLQNYSGPLQASNALELLGIGLDNWISTNTYESNSITITNTTTEDVASTRDTLLSDLGVTTGEYYIWKDGVKYTAYISSDETLGSLMETLEGFGIASSLVNNGSSSVLSLEGSGDCYIAKSANITNASNIVEQLFTAPSGEKYIHSGLQQTSEFVTTYSAATEDTLLSYFDEGVLTAEGDLSITIDGFTSTVLIEPDETIGSLLTKFRAQGLEATLNDGHIVIQSGYKEFTINSDGTTSSIPATLNLVFNDDLGGYVASNDTVKQTTTNIEERTVSVANYADYDTKMSLLNIVNGTLTLYRDGEKATLNIESEQTFGDLRAQISGRFADVDIKFEDGYLTFYSTNDGVSVEVGATTDTSNFSAITGIQSNGDGTVKSARELYCANSSSIITTAGLFRNGDVKAGTFKIGDAEFTITDTTSLSALISQINASQSANATAYWDSVDGKLVIQSRTTGAALVNIEAGTSNFTDIMGFTKSEWADADGDGNQDIGESLATVTKMNVSAQEIGDNARFSINGTYYTSTSNTIGSDVSRIKGVTINLKGISEGETTLTIERDKESIANAVSDVVDAYNDLIENVDKEIAKGSPLDDQFTLKLLRNQIRSLMTNSIGGTGVFKNLDAVGISLNAATAGDIRTDNINTLNFDKKKFIDAFDADRDALKDLLVGTDANLGIFQRVENIVENAITSSYGYFSSAESSYNKQISRLDSKIQKAKTAAERYQERLEAKFASMDLLISQIQNQYSSFLSV